MKKLLLMAAAALMSSAAMAQLEDGQNYFIKNVATGTFMTGGNDWGTHISVSPSADYFTAAVISDGVYTLDSNVSNGGASHFVGSGDYLDAAAANLDITPLGEGIYTIGVGGQFYAVTSGTLVGKVASADDDNAKWQFISVEDYVASLAGATMSVPMDATLLIRDANFSRNNLFKSAWTINAANCNISGGNNNNNCAESYHSTFDIYQTIDVPNGVYGVTAQGFCREDGGSNVAVFYANAETAAFPLKTGTENSMGEASVSFTNGNYTIEEIKVTVTDGKLTIGVKNETSTSLWCIWDNFRLTYYGVPSDDAIKEAYAAKLQDAKDVAGAMNKDVKSALDELILEYETNTPADNDAYNEAISALQSAISAANASIAVYEKIAAINVASLTESGKAACVINTKYAAGEYETLAEAEADFRVAVLAQTEDGADFTGAIVNPDFSTGNINGWKDTFTAGNHGYQANQAYVGPDGATCDRFMECWIPQPNTLANGKLSQVLKNLPAGNYTLTADVNSVQQSGAIATEDLTGVYIFATCAAGTFRSEACATGNGKPEHFSFTFDTTEGDCEIGLMTENTNCNWVAFDNCRLVRNGESTINVYQEALKEAVAEAPANLDEVECAADVKDAYAIVYAAVSEVAITDGLENEDYLAAGQDLKNAKAAVEASAALYANSKSLREAVANGTNVVAYADAIADWTLDHEDGNFHFNTWSEEGLADGTNMGKNFNEYWHNKDASLADGVISYKTLGGLKAGNYAVSVFVRAINEAGGEVSGVKFNDIDITTANATYVKFNALEGVYGVMTSVINVAEGGNLDFGFTVKDAACNWLAWKGLTIKYLGEETADAEASLEITKAGYATFVAPYTTALPAGVKAYTVDNVDDNGTTLVMTEIVGAVPAYTPVVLEGEAVSVTTTGVDYTTVQCETPLVKGMLTGVLSEDVAPEGTYVLQQHGTAVGFCITEEDKVLPANRAYLTADAAEVKVFALGEATAIKALESMTAGKAQIFDLNGRQINSLQKGINIVNGVKVLVK